MTTPTEPSERDMQTARELAQGAFCDCCRAQEDVAALREEITRALSQARQEGERHGVTVALTTRGAGLNGEYGEGWDDACNRIADTIEHGYYGKPPVGEERGA